ncbi:MAG: S4 domain-containing protein, partial [Coprobacillus cateniformis]
MERLQKAIAASGYTSRRKAEDLIAAGRVKVNGEVISELGFKVKKGDMIMIDDKALKGENKVYYV